MIFVFMDTSGVVLAFSMLVKVVDDIGDREHQAVLDTSSEVHPLLGVGVLLKEVIKVLCAQQ